MYHGFTFVGFGDEIGHILGAEVIASGGRLYRDYVDNHGPLPYAFVQAYGALAGWKHLIGVRLIPIVLAAVAVISVGASPALQGASQRLTAAVALAGLLAPFWIVQGLYLVDYQFMAGTMLVVALALDAAPAWVGRTPPAALATIAGASYTLTCFVAYSYGPAAVFLLASRLVVSRENFGAMALGAVGALVAMAVWLFAYADPMGYLVFHFIVNQVYFISSQKLAVTDFLYWLVPHTRPDVLMHGVACLIAFAGAALWIATIRRQARAGIVIALLIFALVLTNPRASPIFQDGAFVAFAVALFSLGLPIRASTTRRPATIALAVIALVSTAAEIAGRHAKSTPHGFTRHQLKTMPKDWMAQSEDPWAQALRRAVGPEERMLVLPFSPGHYVLAGRLPMRGYFDYLPWDAAYGQHPWFGIKHDLCADLPRERPPVIFYNAWVVWDRYDPEKYMPCVLSYLRTNYAPAPGAENFYVRHDRLATWNAALKRAGG